MSALRYIVLCLGVFAVSLETVNGLSEEEANAVLTLLLPVAVNCGKDYGISEEEIMAANKAKTLKDLDPCLLSCFLKKLEVLTGEGNVDDGKLRELTVKFLTAEDDQKKALAIIDKCGSVNDLPVNDGAKGCDRIKHMIDCYYSPVQSAFPGFI